MATLAPRVIVVRRETEMDRVQAVHASKASARFVLKRRHISLDQVFIDLRRVTSFMVALRLNPELARVFDNPLEQVPLLGQAIHVAKTS